MVPAVHVAADRHDSEGCSFCLAGAILGSEHHQICLTGALMSVARKPERIRGRNVGVPLVHPTYIFRFTSSRSRALQTPHASPALILHSSGCVTSSAESACTRRPLSLRRFARACAASQGVHVLEWDLNVPTGEWDERDAKSKG